MKQSTLCLLSGVAGALFAVACGALDGLGKDADAESILVSVAMGTCSCETEQVDGDGYAISCEGIEDYYDFLEEAKENNYVVSGQAYEDCGGEGVWKIPYIK